LGAGKERGEKGVGLGFGYNTGKRYNLSPMPANLWKMGGEKLFNAIKGKHEY
jgi:hypothetical protein